MMSDYEKIMSWLEDEESRYIYKKRMEYREKEDFKAIQEIVDKYLPECKDIPNRLDLVEILKNKERIIIFGAGIRGKQLLHLLWTKGIVVDCIIDNDAEKWGNILEMNVTVVQPEKCDYRGACCVVSLRDQSIADAICEQLVEYGVKEEEIYKYRDYMMPMNLLDKQYFDENIIHLDEGEVFVDVGAADLYTSKLFVSKCENCNLSNYKIYAFEPNRYSYEKYQGNLKKLEQKGVDIKLYNYGLWNENATLYFEKEERISKIVSEITDMRVEVGMLDSFIKDNVTFIKMDIEGAELEALQGGRELIKKNRPKLAISIYHKDEDLTEIPMYIKELVPEYKFYIRHYSNMQSETVLYAVI